MFTATVNEKNLQAIRMFSGIICLLLLASWAAGLPIFIHGIQTNLDSILSLLFNDAWTIPVVQESQVAVILSTMAIAALFLPMRRKVQELIDRRFYRQKYDTARMLVELAETSRDEVELERLTARLMHVVHKTLQPERAAIWLKRNIKQ